MTTLLIGCKPHYPEVEYEGDPGKVEFDNIESRVPIQVAINDPLFESYTRGMGAFDNLKGQAGFDDNWKDAVIYVYAFYAPGGITSSPDDLNYSERMSSKDEEKIFCLVDDTDNLNIGHGKRARLSADGTSFLQWYDNDMVYYNRKYQQYRYKFFAYHIDDAADMTKKPDRRRDHVAYDICIDGTQDLMCACAKPTDKQWKAFGSPSDKLILNNLEELVYSTETGHRDLFPVFDMKHQLALVKFYLKADSIFSEGNKVMDPEVKNMRVKNIIVTVPNRGRFVVASDDTTDIPLGVSFNFDDPTAFEDLYIPVKVKTDADGNMVSDAQGRRITVSRNEAGKVMPGDVYGFNPGIMPEEDEKEVGMGFLLPPADSYTVQLECFQFKTDEQGNQVEENYDGGTFLLELGGGKTFEPGHKYEVCIKVYGQRSIELGMGSVTWKDGGDISVGGEDDEDE